MRLVIQRVSEAEVRVDGQSVGKIGKGFLVLIGICDEDDEVAADRLLKKMIGLRIFEDENGKTNLSLENVGGELLLVSQFTLYADCRKGNRPSFVKAAGPDKARSIYEYMIDQAKTYGFRVQHGLFGADMKVSLINDGPFTVVLDSEELNASRRKHDE